MGIQTNAVLIIGWYVSNKLVLDFLIKNKVGSCCGSYCEYDPDYKPDDHQKQKRNQKKKYNGMTEDSYQCGCGPENCWVDMPESCKDIHIIFTSPYYDCETSEQECYISLVSDRLFDGSTDSYLKILENKELVERAQKLAIELGSNNEVPKIRAVVDVN